MKIGFSFGRCLRDIVKGDVGIDDVVVVVTRTHMNREHIEGVVNQYLYQHDYLMGLSQEDCLRVAYELYDSGRIHQPRAFGAGRSRVPENSVWFDLFPTATTDNPSVLSAWEQYQIALRMSGENPKAEVPIY
jgi:hypothetical protein